MDPSPDLTNEPMLRLSPAVRTVWTLKMSIFLGLLCLGVIVYDLIGLASGSSVLPFGLVSIVALLLATSLSLVIPRLRYRFWRYRLDADELYLERGILNRVRTIVPLRRIQHLDVSQDIIEREFDLGKLIVHTAGARSSDVVLPGLDIEVANHLRDDVKNYILEDAV